MTCTEKVEQFFTSRPNSLVPGKTLSRLINVPASDQQLPGLNLAMHYGQGALAGVIRASMTCFGLQGPFSDFMFIGVRLMIDQTLENWTGVGALPWYVSQGGCSACYTPRDGKLTPYRTWPVNEQVIDIVHKAVYAFTTGYFTDKWIR
jgi:hypothetical protein